MSHQEMKEFFDQCLDHNIDLFRLSNSYILHVMDRFKTKAGSAKKLGISFNGLTKRLSKLGRSPGDTSPD